MNLFKLVSVAALSAAAMFGADINELKFMTGCWVNGGTEEFWLKPAGGSMLGVSRTVKEGKTTFTEYMQLVEEGGSLVMKVQLKLADKMTVFKLIKLENNEATFSNREHDFPQRIIYRREPDGSLFARIEGNRKGKPAHEDYRFRVASNDGC